LEWRCAGVSNWSGWRFATTPTWLAAAKLDAIADTAILTTRNKIFTVKPPATGVSVTTSRIDFAWSSLDSTQQLKLQKANLLDTTTVDATTGGKRLNYLRGERANERTTLDQTKPFRQRDSRLGDIVNSDPQYVDSKKDFGYSHLSGTYLTFRNAILAAATPRPPMVVVGANDGMLHGFRADLDSNGGTELFAYVPNGVYDNLFKLTLPIYEHQYYVDGTVRISDAYSTSWPTTSTTGTNWRTIVVGTTGAGGESVFALDITDPMNMTNAKVLWEFSPPEMGYTLFQPEIVALPGSSPPYFGVIVTSGYEAPGPDGRIWILEPATGNILHCFKVKGSLNLGSPFGADVNGDWLAERIYVGDADGKLWRFDIPDITGPGSTTCTPDSGVTPPALLDSGDAIPLFVDTVTAATISNMSTPTPNPYPYNRPITAAPVAEFNTSGDVMVFFGTGSFYKINDNQVPAVPPIDTFYGIIDRGSQIVGRGTLQEQEILAQVSAYGKNVRAVTQNVTNCATKDGWYLDLVWKTTYGGNGPVGERVVSRAIVRDDRAIFATLIPSTDPCAYGGTSFIMELGMYCGNRLDYSVFDIKPDNKLDDQDKITVNGVLVPVSGFDPGVGIIKTPAIVDLPYNPDPLVPTQVKIYSGSSASLGGMFEKSPLGVGRQSWEQLR
jgi:type IV pilus assembly protein PilY1